MSLGHYLLLAIFTPQISLGSRLSAEHRLYNELFTDYNTNIRPVRHENNTVNITLTFNLDHFDNLDAQKQLLRLSGWLQVEWTDEYLSWNESSYGGIDRIVVPPTAVWLPDFALDNSAGDVYDLKYYSFFRVTIFSDGTVTWAPGGKYECICTVDVAYYPFDNQLCELIFTNWEYTGIQVNLLIGESVINLDSYPGNGEWYVIKTQALRLEDRFACCPDDFFPAIHFVLYLERRSLYYVINVLLPVLFLSLLELLIFILPCDSGEKISLGITIMLGFSVFALLIEESVPNTSEATPIIVIYLTAAMGTAAISVVCSVCILALHHHNSNYLPPPALVKFANSLTMKRCRGEKNNSNDSIVINYSKTQKSQGNGIATAGINNISSRSNYGYSPDVDIESVVNDGNVANGHITRDASDFIEIPGVTRALRYMLSNIDKKETDKKVKEEWKAVAKALDVTLFKIVSMMLAVLAIVILGALPSTKTVPELQL